MCVYQAATRFFCNIKTYRQPDILVSVHLCAKIKCYQHSPSIIHTLSCMKIMGHLFFIFSFSIFLGEQSFFWGCWYPFFGLLAMLQIAMDSSDSPLVWHLLTFWWPAWQPSCFSSTYLHTSIGGSRTRIMVQLNFSHNFIGLALLWLTLQKYQTIYFKLLEETRFFITHRFIITTLIGCFIVSLSVMVLPHSKQLGKASRQFCSKGNKFITQRTCRLQDPGSKWM